MMARAVLGRLALFAALSFAAGTRPAGAACGWDVVNPPSPGTSTNELIGVSAVTANDVFAWGSSDGMGELAHYDGADWSFVPVPSSGVIESLRGLSPDDVWAVGYEPGPASDSYMFIAHWNGSVWSALPRPPLPPQEVSQVLYGVVPLSRTNVYAAGSTCSATRCSALLEHYDGATWLPEQAALPGQDSELAAIAAASASDVWTGGSSTTLGLIERLDPAKGSWLPVASENGIGIVSMSARAPNDVWAVGNPGTRNAAPIQHWNGRAWSVVPYTTNGYFTGVDATGPVTWVVGGDASSGISRPIAITYGTSGWGVTRPAGSRFGTTFNAVSAVPGSRDVWAVGSSGFDRTTNVAEHYVCPGRLPREATARR